MRKQALLLALLLAGCSNVIQKSGDVTEGALVEKTVGLGSAKLPLEKLVFWGAYAAAAYLILDPFAPNWDIEEARLDKNLVLFNLKMKRYYSGGAGEARLVVQRRAKELVREGKYSRYEVLEYNDSLESSVLGSQRVTQAVIRLM